MLPPPLAIPPPWAGRIQAARHFLAARSALLICALFLLAGLVTAGDYGLLYDEQPQIVIATANLNYLLGKTDRIKGPHYTDRVYGVAFELPLLLAQRALGLDALTYEDYHAIHRLRLSITHLFFIIGGFFCYRLAHRLFDSRLIALLALLLYLLHPRLYAHSFFNSKDPPFLSMLAIALYLLERAFRRDTMAAFILLGLAVGLLTNLRIMGVMLFPAVIAMRGLDLFCGAGPERKHILLTAGLFALAVGLALYALSPYAWTNPVDYLAANLALTVNHPTVLPQLFQGEMLLSDAVPPHYAATWFGITTPPLALLLGGLGMAAVLAAGFGRPGAVFRNNRRRFLLLLLACFLLPPLAAALLGSNQYEDWRHFYFSYVPFGLLAAAGLHWLAGSLARRRIWPAGMYGLAGLGLGLVLLQMAQIHPLQHIYFNFLADRTTPEKLRTQYEMDRWLLARRAAWEYLLQSHPGETLALREEQWAWKTLPPAARERLRLVAGGGPADYELTFPDPTRPDLAFNSRYGRFYNNTLVVVRPLDSSRMTPAAIAAYRDLYRQAVADEPIIRADYDVYLDGRRLTFVKENCPAAGRAARFDLKLFPHHPESGPPDFGERSSYIGFQNNPVRLGDLCLSVLQLPADAAGNLILRQRKGGGSGWEELYSLSQPGLGELIADHRRNLSAHPATEFRMSGKIPPVSVAPAAGSGQAEKPAGPFPLILNSVEGQAEKPAVPFPLILNSVEGRAERDGQADFAVFIDRDNGRNRLIYAKADCAQAEYETPATLHIYPESLADLPFHLWQGGLDNRDFALDAYGGRPGGECVAVFPLPDYPIAAIRTGQAGKWEVNLYPTTDPAYLRAAYAALADRQPDARADFDLHWQDNRLIYRRETCAAADTAANFFLHIIPKDIADLPAERQAAGFANRDFAFDRRGGHFDGKCLAAIPLPRYPIAAIRTGQFLPGQGDLWAAELRAAP